MLFLWRTRGLSFRAWLISWSVLDGLRGEPLGHLVRMPPGCFPAEVFWRIPQGRTRTRWRHVYVPLCQNGMKEFYKGIGKCTKNLKVSEDNYVSPRWCSKYCECDWEIIKHCSSTALNLADWLIFCVDSICYMGRFKITLRASKPYHHQNSDKE